MLSFKLEKWSLQASDLFGDYQGIEWNDGFIVSILHELRTDSKKLSFKVNPHGICGANKMVKGKHFAMSWHLGDLQISQKDKAAVDQFIELAVKKHEGVDVTWLN